MSIDLTFLKGGVYKRVLADSLKRCAARTRQGMLAAGEYLLERSKDLIPEDTLTLKEDGHVRLEVSGVDAMVIIGYGTPGVSVYIYSPKENKMVTRTPAEYVVYLHEDISKDHTKGQYEFLAVPLRSERSEMRSVLIGAL